VLLVIIVAVAGKVAELIPLTTLAAILMVIGVEALVREVRHLARARWVSVPHLCAALVTVVVGVVAELTAAIVTGVALSLLLYMFTVADQARIVAWIRRPNGSWQEATPPAELPSGKVTVLALTGGAYFASAYRAEQAFPAHDRTIGAAVVLQLRDRTVYSLTSLEGLTTLVHSLHGHGNRVYLADIDPSQRVALSRSGLLALLGPDAVVWRDPVIGAAAAEATRRAGAWLAGHRPEPSRGSPPKEHQSE
jgi:SulP family sulfate permease